MSNEGSEDPPEDIPAWFMTYSDVITLLMTFFILLLTFSTTEPERYEKIAVSLFGESGATGAAGHKHDKLDRDSWITRVRPRAARIATFGSEMPPMAEETTDRAIGRGLQKVSEEASKKDVMKSYAFSLKLADLVASNNQLTKKGEQITAKIGPRLQSLPVHCVIEIATASDGDRAVAIANHLMYTEGVRPGQVAVAVSANVKPLHVRFTIERYESN